MVCIQDELAATIKESTEQSRQIDADLENHRKEIHRRTEHPNASFLEPSKLSSKNNDWNHRDNIPLYLIIEIIVVATCFYRCYQYQKHCKEIIDLSSSENLPNLRNRVCVPIFISDTDAILYGLFVNLGAPHFGIRELDSMGVVPIIRKISHPEEALSILDQLRSQNNEIPILILLGHGNTHSIEMGGGKTLNSNLLARAPLSPNAHIILYSCSTAQETPNFYSLARKISLLNPDVLVSASRRNVCAGLPWEPFGISFRKDPSGKLLAKIYMPDEFGTNQVTQYKNGRYQTEGDGQISLAMRYCLGKVAKVCPIVDAFFPMSTPVEKSIPPGEIESALFQVASCLTNPFYKSQEFCRRIRACEVNNSETKVTQLARKTSLIMSWIGWTTLALMTTLPGFACFALLTWMRTKTSLKLKENSELRPFRTRYTAIENS
ncbi:MAG TPA: hypothetical protein VLE96_06875 [Chlamydiales bacterium]|nr:hypothetical protein [Chlamydiales bacterium]